MVLGLISKYVQKATIVMAMTFIWASFHPNITNTLWNLQGTQQYVVFMSFLDIHDDSHPQTQGQMFIW